MKKLFTVITLFLAMVEITAQSYQQEEQARLDRVSTTEIEIQNFTSQNINTFDFTDVINKVNKIKQENGQPLPNTDYQNTLLYAKKERLRDYYFEKNPEKIQNYYAKSLQQCFNGGFEDGGPAAIGYSFFTKQFNGTFYSLPFNYNSNPLWDTTFHNNNPVTTLTPSQNAIATVVDTSVNDPLVGIPRTNTGKFAIRLNNSNGGNFDVTKMTRTFTVNDSSISFAFALVLQDGGIDHIPTNTNPYYQVKLFDNNNQPIFTREVMANPSNPLFQQSGNILYTNWLCERISTARYMGQTVRLEIILSDCGQGAHWGYGYFDDFCGFDCTNPSFNPGITLNPLKKECPKFPLPISGNITLPVNSSFTNVTLQVLDTSNNIVSSQVITSAPGGAFSTNLNYSDFYPSAPNNNIEFNIKVLLNYTINGLPQAPVVVNHTNPPGPDVSFAICQLPCLEVINITQPITTFQNYQALGLITANSIIYPDLTVNYKAGYEIKLLPGFYVSGNASGQFRAYIARCEQNRDTNQSFTKQISKSGTLSALSSDATIYPNPTSAFININPGKEKLISWEIYDMSGKLIIRGNFLQIDVQRILKGNYLLKVNFEKRQLTKIVVVQ